MYENWINLYKRNPLRFILTVCRPCESSEWKCLRMKKINILFEIFREVNNINLRFIFKSLKKFCWLSVFTGKFYCFFYTFVLYRSLSPGRIHSLHPHTLYKPFNIKIKSENQSSLIHCIDPDLFQSETADLLLIRHTDKKATKEQNAQGIPAMEWKAK